MYIRGDWIKTCMGKTLKYFFLILTCSIFVGLFSLLKETFFFHDEWTFLYQIINSPKDFIFSPHNDHFMPLFKLIYFLEYKLFGLNYPLYQLVLLIFHFANAYLLLLIIQSLTKNKNLGILAFFLFLVSLVYWEVIFASATLPTVLCLFLIGLAIFYYLRYEDKGKRRDIFLSALCSLLSAYAWGAGLFFPLTFFGLFFLRKIWRKETKIEEFAAYLGTGVIAIVSYKIFVRPVGLVDLDLKKITTFTLEAIKWIILSFYTSSPGFATVFLLLAFLAFLAFYPVFKNRKSRDKFFNRLKPRLPIILFSLINFVYPYILSATFRYRIDMELAKSSRYTYLPLFFLIIINIFVLDALIPCLAKKLRVLFLLYFVFLSVGHIYFFRIYYQNWTATISGPNRKIFERIIQASEEELNTLDYPSTFHSFLTPKQIYLIYRQANETTGKVNGRWD